MLSFIITLMVFFRFAYTEHWSMSAKEFQLITIQYFPFVTIGYYGAKNIYVALKNLHINIVTLTLYIWALFLHKIYSTNTRFLGLYESQESD